MEIDDPMIVSLKEQVDAAVQEFELAITFHEAWKPAAFDKQLHKRMGPSYASQTFLAIRLALRREMLLALARLWDDDRRAVRLCSVACILKDKRVIQALAEDRATRLLSIPGAKEGIRRDLESQAKLAIEIISKYSKNGTHAAVLTDLLTLRNRRLAHREITTPEHNYPNASGEQAESLYNDMAKLMGILCSTANGVSYNLKETEEVYRHYAKFFWAGIRGEKT